MKRIIVIAIAALMGFSAYAADTVMVEASAQVFKKAKAEVKEVVFNVNLHCNSCVKKVQENISFEKGVKGLEVSLEKQTVAVKYDPAKTSVETLKKAIEKLNVPVKSVECPQGK